jgi:hypothetical protein
MPCANVRLRFEQLVAPATHLGVMIEPAAREWAALVRCAGVEDFSRAALLDTSIGALRAQLRGRLNIDGPAIVTGHQAEFFHAGVFAKTIAAQVSAARVGGQAFFLSVDADLPKTTQMTVPQTTSGGVRRVDVAIPGAEPHVAFEFQPPRPRDHWAQFFARVGALYEFYGQSLLGVFASGWMTAPGPLLNYCDALAAGRAAVEASLGLEGVRQLRASQLSTTATFRAFAAHCLLHAGKLAECYNAAQADYRRRHKIRTPGRPVPALLVSDSAIEIPLWVVRRDEPRRRLFVTPRGSALELRTDKASIAVVKRGDLEHADRHAEPWPLEREGWELRPRALTLSAFARLFFADIFIHGIGGAKYDELMEDFARAFFGVQPAPATCVTATLHLPLPHSRLGPQHLAAARRDSRDVRFNPQRHIDGLAPNLVAQRAELVRRSQELARQSPQDHDGRRVTFRELRRMNEQMLEADPWRAAKYDERVEMLEEQAKLDRVALDREYFFALQPRDALRWLVEAMRREFGTE